MVSVRIANKRVWVGDESRALIHGEVHYWRLSPARWRDVLQATRALGLDIISTYVPWQFHELAPGEFDFTGTSDPARDLVGFLELAAEYGFWVLIRPGPYIYAEWPNSGVPERVVRFHRAHAEFRREAERYMAAVVAAFAPFLATRGGPVILVQADNEPDAWADVYGAQLGLGQEPGLFQELMGGDVRPVQAPLGADSVPHYVDVVRFFHRYATDIVRWTADTYRRLGVDVPQYANTYLGFGVQDWRSMQAAVDFVGPDVYPTAELRDQPGEHRGMLERLRFTRTFAPLPYIPEFEAGIWHGWHERVGVLRPNHYRLICLSALLAGVAGWGWYMLVNRDNWAMSPIDELGRARPDLAAEFGAIVRVFRQLDPPSLEKVGDTAVAMDVLQLAAHPSGPPGEPVLEALYDADVDYECFDVDTGQISKRLLFYAAADTLTPAAQQQLSSYVHAGGTLVVFQNDVLDLARPHGVVRDDHRRPLTVELGSLAVQCISRIFGWYTAVPGEPIYAERGAAPGSGQQGHDLHRQLPIGERYIIGYREPRGRGSIVRLAISPSPEIVIALHRWLDVPIPSHALGPHVSTALFRAPDGTMMLIAVNNGDEERMVSIELSATCQRATDLFTGTSRPVHNALTVSLARKSGTALRLD